jgi:hypothetical protein
MANKTLNRPNNWQKQVNPNTKRMRQLMRDVRANVERRTRNSQDLDAWMENLSGYVGNNCFSTGIHATDALDIVNQIAGVVDQTSLPAGSNAEILKGTMAEKCYTMVTNVGEDIKNELRQIAVNGYNDRLTPQQLAKEMGNKIESLDKARCQAIARTETCRAANIGNYINAREMGAKSYSVICNDGCCEYCQEAYGTDESGGVGEEIFDIEDTDSLPPFHPNCRCTPVWSMDPPPGSEDETSETNEELENETNEPTENDVDNILDNQEAIINNALANALKDVGLTDIAPEKISISPDVKITKNIETTHKSNLWENLAKKHNLELVEASNTKVTFYDTKYKTPIRFDIPKNKEWIDYTNSGSKQVNMDAVLKYYNSATPIQKKATPIMIIQGKNIDHGAVTIGNDTFKLELYKGAFVKEKGSVNGGNLKGAMHHEMWHCVDIRMTQEDTARNNIGLNSSMKGSKYKSDVTKDRRAKKKTGGQQFCSEYARQSGGGNKVYEDFAEAGSVMSSNTYLIISEKGKYVKMTKSEFIKRYPNRAAHFEDLMKNGKLLW